MRIKPGDRVTREPDGPTLVVVDVAGDEPLIAVLRAPDDQEGRELEAAPLDDLTVVGRD